MSEDVLPAASAETLKSWRDRWRAELKRPRPLLALTGISVVSLGARAFHLGIPSEQSAGQGFVFDERYYVNAARVIAGVPVRVLDPYALAAPAGADPNGEHPQLGKIIIAATIRLFGDNPIGWRLSAVIFGTLAILLLYWLIRCAGGSTSLALAAAALAGLDNLWLVSARIAVLDIYVVPFMLAGTAFYLRRRPIVAGLIIAVGACVKEFCLYTIAVLILLAIVRAIRWPARQVRFRELRSVAAVVLVTTVVYLSLLTALDIAVPPYSGGQRVDRGHSTLCNHALVWKRACYHTLFMTRYAAKLHANRTHGIASYPWQFWLNETPITYYQQTKLTVHNGRPVQRTIVWFRGLINPVLLYTSWAAIILAALAAFRRRDEPSLVAIAWVAGTWLPTELLSVIAGRITYLYYMVVVMPGIYLAVARLLQQRLWPRLLVGVWIGLYLAEFFALYPFRTWSGT